MLLTMFRRIFPSRALQRFTLYLIFLIILNGFVFIICQLLQCLPIDYNWEGWHDTWNAIPHTCVDIGALTTANAAITIFYDLVIFALPFPLVLKLSMSWKKKAEVVTMFGLGIFLIITSCLRLRFIVLFHETKNPTWDFTDVLIVSKYFQSKCKCLG
jgi:hypothetical protein